MTARQVLSCCPDDVHDTLSGLFASSAWRYPGRAALWVDGSAVTYQELYLAALRIAAALIGACRKPAGQVALLVDRTLTAYAGVLGTLLAGHTYVPLNRRFPAARLRSLMKSGDVDAVVVDHRSLAAAEAVLGDYPNPLLIVLPDEICAPDWAGRAPHDFLCRADLEALCTSIRLPSIGGNAGAYLLFTSGSTGQPKGVLVKHRNVLAYLDAARERYGPRPNDRFTQLFDLSFDLSVHDMFLCWSAGAGLYCVPQSATSGPRDLIRRHDLTFWFSVPSTAAFMARMRMLKPNDYPSLRWSLFCGEPLPLQLAETWRQSAPNSTVENLYGPTEATIAITAYRLRPGAHGNVATNAVVPIGRPFSGQGAAVVGPDGRLVPEGEAGELYLFGSQVTDGYWKLPETTAARFAPPLGHGSEAQRWYRTGDRVVMDRDHGLLFLGRIDRQVKIRGHRVELQEIETVLRAVTGSDSVAAIAWPVEEETGLARGIIAFVADATAELDSALAQCRAWLPDYMVPSQVHCAPDWPLNASGKTDYNALRARLRGNR